MKLPISFRCFRWLQNFQVYILKCLCKKKSFKQSNCIFCKFNATEIFLGYSKEWQIIYNIYYFFNYFLQIFANKQSRTWVLSRSFSRSLTPFSFSSTFSSFLLISSKISVGRVSDFRQSPVCTQLLAASKGPMVDDVVVVGCVLIWN